MKTFYNLKIASKLLIAFAAVLALTAALGIFAVSRIEKVNGSTEELAKNWMPSVQAVLDIKSNMARYRVQELQHIISTTAEDMSRYEGFMSDILAKLEKDRESYAALISLPEERALYEEITRLWERYLVVNKQILQLSRDDKNADALALIRGESFRLSRELNERIDRLVKLNVDGGKSASEQARNTYDSSLLWIVGILIGAIVIGILLALWIARIVSRPMQEALRIARTVAAGDLSTRIEATTTDETGQLLQALREMNDSLARIVGEVRSGTESISTASSQIASGNLDLSSRTEQQASSLEETASSMEELTSTVRQNADNAQQANQLAQSASGVALKGGEVVAQVVDTMGAINDSARKIVDIISVIDGIAFQTNILALNAAVEAARAGEQGRGFAVVASEVRNLAQRSAAAAKEIKALIGDSVEKVDLGARLVDQAGETMEEIVNSVKRVTDIMNEITAASREQAAGIAQVNDAITQMDQVTQQNAALVEEAAAAAESLQDQSASLARSVSVFRLDRAARPEPAGAVAPKAKEVVKLAAQPRPARLTSAPRPQRPPLRKVANADTSGEWEQF